MRIDKRSELVGRYIGPCAELSGADIPEGEFAYPSDRWIISPVVNGRRLLLADGEEPLGLEYDPMASKR